MYGVDDIWGADLVDMKEWSTNNKGYKYMLNVIDVYSKYVWSVPLKDKTGETTTEAFKHIVKISNRIPKHLWVDKGKEFYNKNMDQWLENKNLTRYFAYGEHKCCVVERFNMALKERRWRRFTTENTRNWVNMVEGRVTEYNTTVHGTTGMNPVECSKLKHIETIAGHKVS